MVINHYFETKSFTLKTYVKTAWHRESTPVNWDWIAILRLYQWLNNSIEGKWADPDSYEFESWYHVYFSLESDAILYRLTWL